MGFGFMMLFPILFLVAIVVLLIWAAGGLQGAGGTQTPRESRRTTPDPLEILSTRYARGEITREEYEEMRSTLLE